MSGLEVSRGDGVVRLVLDGSRGNALDEERYAGLHAAADSAGPDDVLLLSARGRHFCAGQDLAAHAAAAAAGRSVEALRTGAEAVLAVLECRAPVVVAAQGAAIGAGALLAACADLLVLAEDAWLRLPELRLGLPLGAAVASRLLPGPQVRRMMLDGSDLPAAEVARHGGARLVPRGGLEAAAERAVAGLRGLDRPALLAARALWGDDERARTGRAYRAEVEAAVTRLRA